MDFRPKIVDIFGMKVVLIETGRQSVMVEAMIKSGSREEQGYDSGAAHFLEHLIGRGTTKYPEVDSINKAVEWAGGSRNAYTGFDSMGYWVKLAREKADLAIDLVAQEVTAPLLPEAQFENERGIILEEIKMYEDDHGSKAFETMWPNLFGSSGLSRLISGTVETVGRMKRQQLRDYYDQHYFPENTMLAVVGGWEDEDKILDKVKKSFGGYLNKKSNTIERDIFVPVKQKKPIITLIKRKIDQSHISIGFRGLKAQDKRRFALFLVNIILGASTTSKLYKEVRESRGWAYSIGTGVDSFADTGSFSIGGGVKKEKADEAFKLIVDIVSGLAKVGSKWEITTDDLEKAKDCYKGRVSLKFDDPGKVAGFALSDLLYERPIANPDFLKQEIDRVTLDDIRDVVREVFDLDSMSVAVVGDKIVSL